jgi:hypothetical protein
VTIRDREAARDEYEPKAGAQFTATDTEAVYIGTGDEWMAMSTRGKHPTFDSVRAITVNGIQSVDPDDGYDGLQSALDATGDAPGTVFIEPGTVDDIDGNVTIPDNTWLRGGGMFSTTLAFASEVSLPLAGMLRIEGQNVVVSDLALDGNRDHVSLSDGNLGQEYGVYTDGAKNVVIQRVYCHDFPGYGFDPHADGATPSRDVTIASCVAENNGLDGVTLAGVANATVTSTRSVRNDRHGIATTDSEGNGATLSNNVAVENGGNGVVVQNEQGAATITENAIEANGRAGIRLGSSDTMPGGVLVTDNLIRDNETYGLNVRLARNVTVTGNQFDQNNTGGSATAEIVIKGSASGQSQDILLAANRITCRGSTAYGIDEREDAGPSLVATNLIKGYDDSAATTGSTTSMRGLNLTV